MKNKNHIVIEGQEWYHEGAKGEKVVGTVRIELTFALGFVWWFRACGLERVDRELQWRLSYGMAVTC